jgi:hypothetical protein
MDDSSGAPATASARIAWTDGSFRVELRTQAAGLRLSVFAEGRLVLEEAAPTAAAGARRAHEVVAAVRRGERPETARGSA